MRDFERGVRASVAALGTLGRYSIGDVTILLAYLFPLPATEAFSGIMAMANGAADSSECQIVLYLIGSGASREEAATTVAHEIFHCVQAATYSPGQYGAYRRVGGAAWWIEGSAKWFASLALPDDSMYQSRVDTFDALSPDTPLHRMTYSALPFFLWHAQRHWQPGHDAVPQRHGRQPGGSRTVACDGGVAGPGSVAAFCAGLLRSGNPTPARHAVAVHSAARR